MNSDVTIFHNPRCSTSRGVLAAIRDAGFKPKVVEYLQVGWTAAQLKTLAAAAGVGVRGLLRAKEPLARELNLADADESTLLNAMIDHPVVVERPIVTGPGGTILCRPPERVREALALA